MAGDIEDTFAAQARLWKYRDENVGLTIRDEVLELVIPRLLAFSLERGIDKFTYKATSFETWFEWRVDVARWNHLFGAAPPFPNREPSRPRGYPTRDISDLFEDLSLTPTAQLKSNHWHGGRGGRGGGSSHGGCHSNTPPTDPTPAESQQHGYGSPNPTRGGSSASSRAGYNGGGRGNHSSQTPRIYRGHWPFVDAAGAPEFQVHLHRGVRPYVFGGNRDRVTHVEQKFGCQIEANTDDNGDTWSIWPQALSQAASRLAPTENIKAAYDFLVEYGRMTTLPFYNGGNGPYIDRHCIDYHSPGYWEDRCVDKLNERVRLKGHEATRH
ncbi:hypothetical protein BDZ45DRAFT_811920 [Acephala macrosclerotiorum]|nr:hypothetical protein BDZ45DRAFT_811920 [Acephala macrosclerotiorum]